MADFNTEKQALEYRKSQPVKFAGVHNQGDKAVTCVEFADSKVFVKAFANYAVAKAWVGRLFAQHLECHSDDDVFFKTWSNW